MRILFVFTGGTIGSTADGDYISPDSGKPYLLLEKYRTAYGIDFDYDVCEPYTELSENNGGETLMKLAGCLKEKINCGYGYDGIIVTHGTDTLQYTAAVLSYTLAADMPICLVSSNYPIENPIANGLINLHSAVSFIKQTKSHGVWAAYKNEGDFPKIHRGTRLLAGQAFTDSIYSAKNAFYGWFDSDFNFHRNGNYSEKRDETKPIDCGNLVLAQEKILRIEPYPGMRYPADLDGVEYIIHGSYHSGTVNTKTFQPENFFENARKAGIKILLTGVTDGESYESTSRFDELGIVPVGNISPLAVYVKVWLCVSAGIDPMTVVRKSLGGDVVSSPADN